MPNEALQSTVESQDRFLGHYARLGNVLAGLRGYRHTPHDALCLAALGCGWLQSQFEGAEQ